MTVKDRVGRTRYVAFALDREVGRRELAGAIRQEAERRWGREEAAAAGLWLAAWGDGRGLLKVKHVRAVAVREVLAAVGARSLGTSGTARAAKRRWTSPAGRKAI